MAKFEVSIYALLFIAGYVSAALLGAAQPGAESPASNSVTEAPWAPATQPRQFSYNVMDNIQGANQIRQESWNNGTMSGMYAYPYGPDQWQVVHYVADARGFRVTSTKIVSPDELMDGHQPAKDSAQIDINNDGAQTSYKVKGSDLNQKQKQQGQQPEQAQKGFSPV